MLELHETERYLKQMISKYQDPTILNVWNEFKLFTKMDVNCTEPAVLFECGVYSFTGKKLFHFDFVRQFYKVEENDEPIIEQLRCQFLFAPSEELKQYSITFWSYDLDHDLDTFFARVEELQVFQDVIQNYVPVQLEVYQNQV
ncbi:hypothetical protein [Brevibacillus dissolubilis]|uniref:hypothetical protein n=1 Tax=Brevibacillus dissolubilis TaxID=1844116 RepID=UPI001116C5A2|nr:hypothetical protein [Brevibacillus dissolubilis]